MAGPPPLTLQVYLYLPRFLLGKGEVFVDVLVKVVPPLVQSLLEIRVDFVVLFPDTSVGMPVPIEV
jgi:hypothetical protein